MVSFLIGAVLGFVGGFVFSFLFFRANKNKAAAVNKLVDKI